MSDYQICTRCIMDTSDPEIVFDAAGVCNHCTEALTLLKSEPYSLPADQKLKRLEEIAATIRAAGKGKPYDCIIGVSGGVDSTYVALKVKQFGLRPLAIHLDNGWNSRLAVTNVEKTLNKMKIDLFTYVINWPEFRDLQLSFLKASTPDSEIPSDHAIVSILYKLAAQKGIRYIIGGMNASTESILPKSWSQGHADWKYINSVQKRFGTAKLKTFPHRTLLHEFHYRLVKKIRWVNILDYMDYSKKDAIGVLEKEVGWENYGGKHHESIYTRIFQAYILPEKFGYDKRRAHLASMIMSGEISREGALEELKKPLYDPAKLREDKEYLASKFGISAADFEGIMKLPHKHFRDYPNYQNSWYSGVIDQARALWRKRNRPA